MKVAFMRCLLSFLLFALTSASGCGRVQLKSQPYNVHHRYQILNSSRIDPKIRIVGGENAQEGAWPWQALIHFRDRIRGRPMICGGTLISRRHVLTAAHCAYILDVASSTVLLGTIDSSSMSFSGKTIDVVRATVHSRYIPNEHIDPSQKNDIAVLTLSSPAAFSQTIQPICLPSLNTSLTLDYAYGTGFGAYNTGTNVGSVSSRFLRQVVVPIIPNEKCSDIWRNLQYYGGGFTISPLQMCAGTYGKGTAMGDSGGPLVVQHQDGRWFQVGITSFGVNEGPLYYDQAKAPGVYTRVSEFCSFIASATDKEVICDNTTSLQMTIIPFSAITFVTLLFVLSI